MSFFFDEVLNLFIMISLFMGHGKPRDIFIYNQILQIKSEYIFLLYDFDAIKYKVYLIP